MYNYIYIYIYICSKNGNRSDQIHYLLSAVIVIVQSLFLVPEVLQSSRNVKHEANSSYSLAPPDYFSYAILAFCTFFVQPNKFDLLIINVIKINTLILEEFELQTII